MAFKSMFEYEKGIKGHDVVYKVTDSAAHPGIVNYLLFSAKTKMYSHVTLCYLGAGYEVIRSHENMTANDGFRSLFESMYQEVQDVYIGQSLKFQIIDD